MQNMSEKPSNTIDFEPVSIEEAAKVASPAAAPLSQAQLDAKYEAPRAVPTKTEDIIQAAKIIESLQVAPEVKHQSTPEIVPLKQENLLQDKKLSLGDFMKRYGSKELQKDMSDGVKGYDTPSGIALDISSNAPTTGLKAASAALAVGAPVLGVLMAATAAPVAAFALPAVAAGIVAYGGYKMFKTWRAKRAFKKNFGESTDEALGYA